MSHRRREPAGLAEETQSRLLEPCRRFGIVGNWNAANAALFEQSLEDHVNDPATMAIPGTYRGTLAVTHHYNPQTGRNVMVDAAGELVSGWILSVSQEGHLLATGNVQ